MLDALPGGHVVRTGSLVLVLAAAHGAFAQDDRPSLRAGSISGRIVVDGQLSETAWESAEAIESFRQTDRVEGAAASAHTRVQSSPIDIPSSSASSATSRIRRGSSASACSAPSTRPARGTTG